MNHHRKQLCQKTISQQAAMLISGSKRQGFLSSYELSWQKRFSCCARQWSPSVFYTLFLHCVKSVRIRSFSGLYFPRIRTGYVEIRSIFLYSVRMWENMDQKNSEYKHFSSSVNFFSKVFWWRYEYRFIRCHWLITLTITLVCSLMARVFNVRLTKICYLFVWDVEPFLHLFKSNWRSVFRNQSNICDGVFSQ